jgi:hypothetical protein
LILSLLQIKSLPLTRTLVRRAEHLDRRHLSVPGPDVDNLDVSLGHRLDIEMYHERAVDGGIAVAAILLNRRRIRDGGCGVGAWQKPGTFNDGPARIVHHPSGNRQFNVNPLLHSRPEIAR